MLFLYPPLPVKERMIKNKKKGKKRKSKRSVFQDPPHEARIIAFYPRMRLKKKKKAAQI